jgi:ribose/xylose/arabinose/galactoside ABC-type transport system permease subunit
MNALAVILVRRLPWLAAGAVLLTLVLWVPAFSRPGYWVSLSAQYFAPAALAMALTPVILTGGIDLSVGSTAVLSSVVAGVLWRDAGLPLGVALAGGVLAGALAGLGNGLLVTAGVLPLVATLATRELYRGLAWALSGDNPVAGFPPALGEWWDTPVWGLPPPVWALAGLWLVCNVVVHHTWMGRMLFAVGDNAQAARFACVPVRRLGLGLYTFSGLVAGLCGASLVLQYDAAKADAERSLELRAIACVVVGGARVTGGWASMTGTLLGAVTVCALLGGLTGVASNWRDTVSGGVLIAVALANEAGARWLLGSGAARQVVLQGGKS